MRRGVLLVTVFILGLLLIGCSDVAVSKSEARRQLKEIADAAARFKKDNLRPPQDVEELEEQKYITINASVRNKWEFYLNWPDDVEAVSTHLMPGGEGIVLKQDLPVEKED